MSTGVSATAAGSDKSARIGWLDSVRGVGIILVVIGHALGGLIDSPLGSKLSGGREAYLAIYTFHMPLFFMISGLFVSVRLERDPIKFGISALTTLAWPYFLWSAVQWTVIYQLGNLVNHPAEYYWPTLINLPWSVVSQFWFLHSLFLLHVLAMLALPRLGAVGFFLFCVALKAFAPMTFLMDFVRSVADQAPAYGLGVMLGAAGLQNVAVDRPLWLKLFAFPLLAGCVLWLSTAASIALPGFDSLGGGGLAEISRQFALWPVAIACIVAVVGLSSLIRGPLEGALRYLGNRTMVIFVLHVMAIAGARIGLTKFLHVDDINILLPILILCGLAFPLVADLVFRRLRISKYLGV